MEWFVTADEWRFLSTAVGVLFVLLALPGGLGALVIRIRDDLSQRIAKRHDSKHEALKNEAPENKAGVS
jgi:hypothetical protein